MKRLLICIIPAFMIGCATIPNGGYHGNINALGTIGKKLDTVRLGQGLLVGTARLKNNRYVNLQINKEDVPASDPLYYKRTLTIGDFSKLLGSGFTMNRKIYYRKRIWYNGKDVVEIDGQQYLIEWKCNYKDPLSYIIADMYSITFRTIN